MQYQACIMQMHHTTIGNPCAVNQTSTTCIETELQANKYNQDSISVTLTLVNKQNCEDNSYPSFIEHKMNARYYFVYLFSQSKVAKLR